MSQFGTIGARFNTWVKTPHAVFPSKTASARQAGALAHSLPWLLDMEPGDLQALAETFYENVANVDLQRSPSLDEREFWVAHLSQFATIVADAVRAGDDRDVALRKISELATTTYEQLAPHDKLMGAGRALRSILDVAAAAKRTHV